MHGNAFELKEILILIVIVHMQPRFIKIDKQIDKQKDGQIYKQIDKQIEGWLDRQINKWIKRQTDGQIDR